MKFWPTLAFSLVLPLTGSAATIAGLYNTGVDGAGNPLIAGVVDPHYTDTIGTNTVYVIGNYAWASVAGVAMYVAPDTNYGQNTSGGVYTLDYVISFNLAGLDPASVLITGKWATDNSGVDILVNGHSTNQTSPSYSTLTPFSLTGASGFFTSGTNTLDFKWANSGGPGGLAVEFTSGTANPASTGAPEPGSMILFGGGLATVGLFGRRKLAKQR